MSSFYRLTQNGVVLRVYVKPRAKESKAEILNDYLRVYLKAVPEGGRANQELISFLSKLFSVPEEKVKILRGKKGQIKEVFVNAVSEERLIKTLNSLKSV